MNKGKYTQGEWRFDGHGINAKDGERIAKVQHSGPYCYDTGLPVRNERFDADSRLIAAAPELLEACKRALPWIGKMIANGNHLDSILPKDAEIAMDMLQDAIDKAEGRGKE
jgi:hypothetical protein